LAAGWQVRLDIKSRRHRILLQRGLFMNTPNMRRTLLAALTTVALAAITPISYAARDTTSETALAEASQPPAPAIVESRHAGRGTPLTLYMEDSNGKPFRLVHVQGAGWRYAEGWKSPNSTSAWLLRKVAFWSTASARPAPGAPSDDEPLTVFIDGPSAFTFVWDRDGGWKFVGTIANRSH
jgi:hypothetical protein